ncbi:L,D-transpeptidase [Lutibacter sp.]|uniref:L,D-transpeptidase n=1 Tax=Lutibacter sp. TaxID=1925666 RepID=UPI003562F72E
MLRFNFFLKSFSVVILFVFLVFDTHKNGEVNYNNQKIIFSKNSLNIISVLKNVKVKDYFRYIDSLVNLHNLKANYTITEHILVRANHWIIDTLENTDYYRMIKKDSFVYNQKEMIVLPKGSNISIPDSTATSNILNAMHKTMVAINIPEFKLRIFQDSMLLYEFPIRVGRNEKKYLKMGNRVTDLKTITGNGKIVNHNKNPNYYNPVNGRQYYLTRRDDYKVTKLPQIPFIETEIEGIRNGQLIHPTTNPNTLNKSYSNGCIGTSEADAWIIYYYAPIGTKINISYNLNSTNENGETVMLKDIYGYNLE